MNSKDKNKKRAIANNRLSNRFTGAAGIFDDTAKQQFVVSIENKEASSRKFAIFAGLLNTTDEISHYAGSIVDYIATDGSNSNGQGVVLNVVTSDGLALLRRYLNNNPTAVTAIQVQAKDLTQLSKAITSKRVNPLRKFGEDRLIPQSFQTSKDANNTLVNIDVQDTVLGDQSLLVVDVAPNSWVNLTFFFGEGRDDYELTVGNESSKA